MRTQRIKFAALLTVGIRLGFCLLAEAGGGQQYRWGGGGGSISKTLSSGERATMIDMRGRVSGPSRRFPIPPKIVLAGPSCVLDIP